jgi:hypothetical protein
MNALVAKLQPQAFKREEEDEDFTGYGNLDQRGFVTGMALPRVADVSVHHAILGFAHCHPSPFASIQSGKCDG